MGVQELLPPDLPLIIDSKHGDLNSASVMAAYVFRSLQADAVTLMPLAGQDITAPFPMYHGKGVVIHCHRSNPAAGVIHDHPAQDNPLFVQVVRVSQGWGTPDQMLMDQAAGRRHLLRLERQME